MELTKDTKAFSCSLMYAETSKLSEKEADSVTGTQKYLTIYDLCQNIMA